MKCEKFVKIKTEFGKGYRDDVTWSTEDDYLGVYFREDPFKPKEDGPEVLFGRCDIFGYMSHMCYGASHIDSWDSFLGHAKKHGYHYFDAGSNGRPVRVSYEELKRAMTELGLVSND